MKFQVHNLQNGSMKECDLLNLSRSLSVDSEIVLFNGEKVEAIGFINRSLLVYFCVEFADYALQNYTNKKIFEAEECISLVRKWIENPNSVSEEELKAAYAAASAADAPYAAYAAYAAADAGKNKEKEFERQGRFILSYFCS